MVNEYNFVYVRNPTTICNHLWYTDRQHAIIMDFNSQNPYYESVASVTGRHLESFERLNTEEERLIEGQLFLQAVQDLYNYIVHANQDRKFLISFMKLGKESSKFGCRYENGAWLLTYFANCEVNSVEEISSYSFEFRRLVELADHNDLIGIALIEAIPHVVPNVVPM
jgi:hypothetical protein